MQAKAGGYLSSKNTIVDNIVKKASKDDNGQTVAYICENFTCGLPIHDEAVLMKTLCSTNTDDTS